MAKRLLTGAKQIISSSYRYSQIAVRDRVIFSGIQPSGSLHLGNYFGAVRQWLQLQEDPFTQCYISIVDLHAITTRQYPDELRENILQMAASILATGIDPNDVILFQQSRVPEHAELAWILGSTCMTVSHLQRQAQYKDRSEQFQDGFVPLGLLLYPVLQAADILLYRCSHVPVGEDQEQNLQIASHIVRSFNRLYKEEFFPEPVMLKAEYARVKSLRNPHKKMSKSDPDPKSRICIDDKPDEVRQKIRKALTDFIGDVFYEPESRPAVSSLMTLHSMITDKSIDDITMESVSLNTAQYKQQLAEDMVEFMRPMYERYVQLRKDERYLLDVLEYGHERARETASMTLQKVKRLAGMSLVDEDAVVLHEDAVA